MLLKILLLTDKRPFLLMGTTVSSNGNYSFPSWERSFLLMGTVMMWLIYTKNSWYLIQRISIKRK